MSKKEYIAYEGVNFTIEWYYNIKGESQSFSYFDKLSSKMQDKLMYLFKRIGDHGKISDKTKFRHEGDQIYAFKPQPERFLSFFLKGKKIIITNAFYKKSHKIPVQEKLTAIECRKDYLQRTKKGDYYEEE